MKHIVLYFLVAATFLSAQSFSSRGQLSGWGMTSFNNVDESQFGIRYLPQLSYGKSWNQHLMDVAVSYNFSANYNMQSSMGQTNLDPYRLWVRYSNNQLELRAGLQKISFGSATMLRPLMWFDKLDPRDPTQFTTGVYGLLFRYYFLNNANIWLWGLYGNEETKGMEFVSTANETPEFGGRLQYPVGTGELAFTFHHRQADFSSLFDFDIPQLVSDWQRPENRFALDGKWDLEIGLWFESVLIHTRNQSTFTQLVPMVGEDFYQKYMTIGADYTFAVGNGLTVSSEYLWMDFSNKIDQTTETNQMAAVMTNYPLSLWDTFMAMWYMDINNDDFYQFYTWQRTFDNWNLNVSVYLNPETSVLTALTGQDVTFGLGNGIQLMLVYNY